MGIFSGITSSDWLNFGGEVINAVKGQQTWKQVTLPGDNKTIGDYPFPGQPQQPQQDNTNLYLLAAAIMAIILLK